MKKYLPNICNFRVYTAENFQVGPYLKNHSKVKEFQQLMWAMTVFRDVRKSSIYDVLKAANIVNSYLGQQREIRLENMLARMNPIPVDQ